jgi:hypothetical protein
MAKASWPITLARRSNELYRPLYQGPVDSEAVGTTASTKAPRPFHLQLDAQHLQRFADKKQGTGNEDSSS